jgi:hypothetical protein
MPSLFVPAYTTSRRRASGNQDIALQGTKDGALYIADYVLGMALEGRVFNASVGTASTVATFLATWVESKPQLNIDAPLGTTIIPLRMQVYLEAQAGALTEIFATSGTNNIGAGTSTAVTPVSNRTDRPVASLAVVNSLYSVAGTTQTGQNEFWHTGYNFADATTHPGKYFEWDYRNNPQVIVGVGSLALYIDANGNTAPTGFIRATWIELPTAYV